MSRSHERVDGPWRERLWRHKPDAPRDEESRLKAGCSQDWLPHKAASRHQKGPIDNRPQVNNLPHKSSDANY